MEVPLGGADPGRVVVEVRYVHARDGVRLASTEVSRPGLTPAPGAPVFLFLHGFAQNRAAFLAGPLPRGFAELGAHVFLGELRGHGRSRLPGAALSHDLATHLDEDLPALVEHALARSGAERLHLVGHSMGGILGYAALARPIRDRLASLVTFAAPVVLGRARPMVRLASLLALPALGALRPDHVPMDRLLTLLAPILCDPAPGTVALGIQAITRLVSARAADPEVLRSILEGSDRESPRVFAELARIAVLGRAELAGVDLVAAVLGSSLPLAAVFGARDIFTSREGLACFASPGPSAGAAAHARRLVLEVPGALHVDVTCGAASAALVPRIWDFAVRA